MFEMYSQFLNDRTLRIVRDVKFDGLARASYFWRMAESTRELLTRALVSLYEEPEQPRDPLNYIRGDVFLIETEGVVQAINFRSNSGKAHKNDLAEGRFTP
jgi:hypothetical protein